MISIFPTPELKQDWADLEAYTTKVFTSKFCQQDGLTVLVGGGSLKTGDFQASQSLFFRDDWQIKDRFRFRFPIYRDKTLDAYVNNQSVKVTLNNGVTIVRNTPLNFYLGFGFKKELNRVHLNIGALCDTQKCHSDNRLKLQDDLTLSYYHKTIFGQGSWKFGFLGVLNLTDVKISKKDIFVGYSSGEYQAYLRAEQAWNKPTRNYNNPRQFFSKVIFTGLYRKSHDQSYGIEVQNSPVERKWKGTLLADYKHKKNELKAKIDTKRVFTFLFQRSVSERLVVSLGVSLPLSKSEGNRRTRTGLRFNFNI